MRRSEASKGEDGGGALLRDDEQIRGITTRKGGEGALLRDDAQIRGIQRGGGGALLRDDEQIRGITTRKGGEGALLRDDAQIRGIQRGGGGALLRDARRREGSPPQVLGLVWEEGGFAPWGRRRGPRSWWRGPLRRGCAGAGQGRLGGERCCSGGARWRRLSP